MRVELKLHDQHALKVFECDEVFYPTRGTVCFFNQKLGFIDTYFETDVARVRTYLDDYSSNKEK